MNECGQKLEIVCRTDGYSCRECTLPTHTHTHTHTHRLPRMLAASPLKIGDEILEINEVPIVDQDQEEVSHAP